MAGPDFSRRQSQRVHVDHRVGCGDLFLGHLSGIEVRPDFALLLISKPNEDIGMLARLNFYRLVQGRQKGRAAPIVYDSISFGNVVEVRSNDYDLVGAARQETNDVRQL